MKPNLMIVGFPKSGTTVLAEYLNRHPKITFPTERDPHSLATDLIRKSIRFHKENRFFPFADKKKYLALFSGLKNLYIGEASPAYIFSEEAPKNIYKLSPQTKIIILVREPIEFLHSLHSHYLRDRIENIRSFETALKLEPLRKEGKHIPDKCIAPCYLYYSEAVKYHKYLKNYFNQFPQENIKIITYEEFNQDNKKYLDEICLFLNIKPFKDFRRIEVNVNSIPKFNFLYEAIYANPEFKAFFKNKMSSLFYNKIAVLVKKIFLKPKGRKPLNPALRTKLMKRFKPEVEKLSALLKKDLVTFWGYDKV